MVMPPEIYLLVDAVRALQITPTGLPGARCIKIGVDKEELPALLLRLREALDAVDAAGALSMSGEDESAKYRIAIDNLLRYMRMRGLPSEDGEDIVRTALGRGKKRMARLEPLPVFAANGWKRRKKIKPTMRFGEEGEFQAKDIRKQGERMNWVIRSIGSAAPDAMIKGPPASRTGGRD